MSKDGAQIVPVDIQLHSKSRLLEITFSTDERFEYPCEYLRVKSHAAEVRTLGRPETGKEGVNITEIEPQGTYAVRLVFDDGHDTGIYSWDTLYDLGKNFDKYWQDYLEALEAIGYERNVDGRGLAEGEKVKIRILYFVQLPDVFGTDSEEVELPDDVTNIEQLLTWLRARGKQQDDLLKDDIVTVTINKQFAEPFTILEPGDEVAIVPKPN
jgi:DUF971 family protein/molybdopterin converting factor small subunit